MTEREKLAAYAWMFSGDWTRIAEAEKNHLVPDAVRITEQYITCLDEDYPRQFCALRYPPWVIFYRGDLSLLKRRMISIVGSRDLQPYGAYGTRWCADLLKQEFVLVSGLAKGADGLVHRRALEGGKTIGIIGSGFSRRYPYCNKDLYQTMEIAALGEALIVTQARIRSGTMLTVNEAASLAKDIYVLPWQIHDPWGEGCSKLISEGAMILWQEEQLKDIMRNSLY